MSIYFNYIACILQYIVYSINRLINQKIIALQETPGVSFEGAGGRRPPRKKKKEKRKKKGKRKKEN